VRVSELVNIRVSDLDLEACKIFIDSGKGNKDRYILFPASFRLALKSFVEARPQNVSLRVSFESTLHYQAYSANSAALHR